MSTKQICCPHCGQQIDWNLDYQASFCPYCGQQITVPSAPPKEELPEDQIVPPAPAAPHFEDLLEQKDPFPASGSNNTAASSHKKAGKPSLVRWYIAVTLWALATGVVIYFADELNILFMPGVLFPLLFLVSFPIWYPCFHPLRKDPQKRKGVWLRWSVIMAVILAVIWFCVEEVF